VEEGRIEYKLHLHTASPERLQRLASQLQWRLREGSGRCVYFLGVSDSGEAVGLDAESAAGSLAALRGMAAEVGAAVVEVGVHRAARAVGGAGGGEEGLRVLRVELTRKAGGGSVTPAGGAAPAGDGGGSPSQPCTPQSPTSPQPGGGERGLSGSDGGGGGVGGTRAAPLHAPFFEPRVALLGAKGSGKSTLVAALSAGQLDDGAGSARGSVVRHRHELEAGCTSSAISCWTVGLDGRGALVPPCRDDVSVASAGSEGHDLLSFRGAAPSDARVHARSASTVALLDLPGRRRCFRSLLSGVLGGAPHGALLVVDGTAALAAGAPCAATAAHAELLAELRVPTATVVTRADLLAPAERARVAAALRAGDGGGAAAAAVGGGGEEEEGGAASRIEGATLFVSCVTGEGLPELARLLWRVAAQWGGCVPGGVPGGAPGGAPAASPAAAPLLTVLDTWRVGASLVVGCLCVAGSLAEGGAAHVGPTEDGAMHAVTAVSVHVRGGTSPDGTLRAGELGSVGLGPTAGLPAGGLRARRLRRGCVLMGGAAPPALPLARRVRAVAPPGTAAARALRAGRWREGASAVLVGASGLKANATVARVDGAAGVLALELARAEYVARGRAVLWDGGVGFLVVEPEVAE
jgi:GTPase